MRNLILASCVAGLLAGCAIEEPLTDKQQASVDALNKAPPRALVEFSTGLERRSQFGIVCGRDPDDSQVIVMAFLGYDGNVCGGVSGYIYPESWVSNNRVEMVKITSPTDPMYCANLGEAMIKFADVGSWQKAEAK